MRLIFREWWMQQIEVQAACSVVKNKYHPKHKDWAPILIDQYKKPKNMQRIDMIHQY